MYLKANGCVLDPPKILRSDTSAIKFLESPSNKPKRLSGNYVLLCQKNPPFLQDDQCNLISKCTLIHTKNYQQKQGVSHISCYGEHFINGTVMFLISFLSFFMMINHHSPCLEHSFFSAGHFGRNDDIRG